MKMTWREEDMYPYVWRNLRARFPAYEGCEIYEKDRWKGYEPDFVVERRFRRRIERVVVEVKATCKVTWTHIKQLSIYARNLSGRNVTIVEKILSSLLVQIRLLYPMTSTYCILENSNVKTTA